MEWTVQCDKLIIELLANRVPPTSIQASILAMARSFFHEHDIVRELPCLKSIRNMRSTVLRVTKSLAAYLLGSAESCKQLHTAFILSSVLQVVASIICGMYGSEQLKYFYQER